MRFPFEDHPELVSWEPLEGGVIGQAYVVRRRDDPEPLVLKLIEHAHPESPEQLKRDFDPLKRLHHTHLCAYEELVRDGDAMAYLRRHVPGAPLLSYLRHAAAPAAAPRVEEADRSADELSVAMGAEDELLDLNSHELERELAGLSAQPSQADEIGAIIAGVARATPVDEPPELDATLAALLRLLPQIISALEHIHRFKRVHGALHPGNILVQRAGLCALTEFGLTPMLQGAPPLDPRETPPAAWRAWRRVRPYMAPEVRRAQGARAASDVYGLGAVLFEALTGRIPPEDEGLQEVEAPSVLELAPRCPSAWAELIEAMLAPAPEARPTMSAIRAALPQLPSAGTHIAPSFVPRPPTLSGRDDVVGAMLAGARAARDGAALPVHLMEGVAGQGKHLLLEHVCHRLARRGWLLLRGVCHDNPAEPFAAWAPLIHRLVEVLRGAPAQLRQELGPELRRAATLFPALHEQPLERPLHRAARALRDVLTRLGAERPIAMIFEQLHLASPDDLALLHALRAEEAPLRAVILGTSVPEARLLDEPWTNHQVYRHEVRVMTYDEAHALLRAIAPPSTVASFEELISQERARSPLKLKELLFELRRHSTAPDRQAPLPTIFLHRVEELGAQARRAVECLALACGPLRSEVAAALLGPTHQELMTQLTAMRLAKVQRGADGVTAYRLAHQLVREVLHKMMDAPTRARHHEALAEALERAAPHAVGHLFEHWRQSHSPERAAAHAALALTRANARRAFARAAQLLSWQVEAQRADATTLWQAQLRAGQPERSVKTASEALARAEGSIARDAWAARLAEAQLRAGHPKRAADALDAPLRGYELRLREPSALAPLARLSDWHERRALRAPLRDERAPSGRDEERTQVALCLVALRHHEWLPAQHALALHGRLWTMAGRCADLDTQHAARDALLRLLATLDHARYLRLAPALLRELAGPGELSAMTRGALLVERARLARARGDLRRARGLLLEAHEGSSRWPEEASMERARLWTLLARVCLEMGQVERAMSWLRLVHRRERHHALSHHLADQVAFDVALLRGDLDAADHALSGPLIRPQDEPQSLLSFWRLSARARWHMASGEPDVALALLDATQDQLMVSGLWRFPSVCANARLLRGQALAGLASLERAIDAPERQLTHWHLAREVMGAWKLRDALDPLEQAQLTRLRARAALLLSEHGLFPSKRRRQALRLIERASLKLARLDAPIAQAECAEARALILVSLDREEGRALAEQARKLYAHLGVSAPLYLEGWPLPSALRALGEDAP